MEVVCLPIGVMSFRNGNFIFLSLFWLYFNLFIGCTLNLFFYCEILYYMTGLLRTGDNQWQ
jgi:hypothetical protein